MMEGMVRGEGERKKGYLLIPYGLPGAVLGTPHILSDYFSGPPRGEAQGDEMPKIAQQRR